MDKSRSREIKGADLLFASVTKPLGVKDTLGDLIAIRYPMNGNDDYSINIGNNLEVNTAVIQMESSIDELISSTGKTLEFLIEKLKTTAVYFLVCCGGRKVRIYNRLDEVYKELVKNSKGVPFITIFTFGE